MAKKISTDANVKTIPSMDLATIRSRFDGLTKQANSLPEGKQKKNILNAIEDTYLTTANAFKGFLAPAPANA